MWNYLNSVMKLIGWIIDEFSKAGLDTAKSILEQDVEDLVKRTDLEEETIEVVKDSQRRI
jgi:hypothetical protein